MTLVVAVTFSVVQATILLTLGPELADILPGLATMVAVFMFGRVWKPKRIFREDGGEAPEPKSQEFGEVLVAWSPFYILTAVIFVWSIPWFKNLFAPDGRLSGSCSTCRFRVSTESSCRTGADAPSAAVWSWAPSARRARPSSSPCSSASS